MYSGVCVCVVTRIVTCQNNTKRPQVRDAAMLSWLGGFCVLVERKSRRVELASFFIAHALYVLYKVSFGAYVQRKEREEAEEGGREKEKS